MVLKGFRGVFGVSEVFLRVLKLFWMVLKGVRGVLEVF